MVLKETHPARSITFLSFLFSIFLFYHFHFDISISEPTFDFLLVLCASGNAVSFYIYDPFQILEDLKIRLFTITLFSV